jgi:hypothetical protein
MWEQHDKYVKQLKQLYNKTSRQTQNRLQELFDTFNFTTENIYNIIDNKTKKRINTYIESWKEQGLLKNNNYFTVLANNIYKRTRVKNSEILELLIYSAYIEEQSKLEEQEKQIMYEDANYYYEQGQQEVNKKKKPSILAMALFLALLDQPNYSGFNWKQYIEATMQYNTQQLYKQAILNIQQQRDLEINSSEFQTIINRQNNQKLNINNDKISGAADLQMIGLNNLAKVEGIKANADDDAQVEFWAVTDEHSTEMCQSMNMMRFYINKENKFDRYWGNSKKDVKLMPVRVKGLVPGINLPPIMYYWHWCRSTIRYVPPVEKLGKIEYNLDIPKISKDIKQVLSNTKLNSSVKRLFNKYLTGNNAKIDNNLNVPMRYSIDDDKIYINPNHSDFKYYDLSKSLTHEIIHMIDVRNNISDKLNIDNELRRARLQIDVDEDKYINLLSSSKYEDNMTLSDIFSAITNGKITGNYGHDNNYWLKDNTRVEKELSANIMSACLTNNKDTLYVIDNIQGLKEIKEKVVKAYHDYTR